MMGSFKEARENLLQAVDYLHENFPNENAVAPYLELAKIEYTQNHPLRTIQYTDQALKEPGIEPRHQLNALSIKCLAIADTSIYKLNTVEYLERFNQVYAEREKIKNQLGRDDIYGADVECWRLINDQKYDEALKVAEKIPSTLIRLEIKQMIYKRMGDYKKAYNTARNHMMIRDSVNSAKNGHLLMEMTSALDLGRVELEAKELKLRNQQMQLEHISDELEQKRLTEEALNLSLKNRDIELANAAIKLQNDSLDQRIQLAKLNEFQSKLHAQEQSERLKLTMLYSAIAIGLLTIAFLCFYLYPDNVLPSVWRKLIRICRLLTTSWRNIPQPGSACRVSCALPETFRWEWFHTGSPAMMFSTSMPPWPLPRKWVATSTTSSCRAISSTSALATFQAKVCQPPSSCPWLSTCSAP